MENRAIDKITVGEFSNRIAFQMGKAIIDLAQSRGDRVAVQVERLNQPVFLYVDDSLPADKHNWLRRKANVALHFGESSLNVKQDLASGAMSLEDTFALDERDYLAKGGAIPVFVKNAGMIAVITVSGLTDTEDHAIIVEALGDKFD